MLPFKHQNTDFERLKKGVQHALDHMCDSFSYVGQIDVETYKGIVQLSGFVDAQKAVDKAVKITRNVKGVKSVKNDLIVK